MNKFDNLVKLILFETRYGTKYGDYRDFRKEFYPEVKDKEKEAPKAPTPLIENGMLFYKNINSYIFSVKFEKSLNKASPDIKQLFFDNLNEWKEGTPIKLELKYRTNYFVWEIRRASPSVHAGLQINRDTRTVMFDLFFKDYDSYRNWYDVL